MVSSVSDDGLIRPVGVTVAGDGVVYAAGDFRVVAIDPRGVVRVVAGSVPGFADGWGADARFRGLTGVPAATPTELLVADSTNALIRRIRLAPGVPAADGKPLPPAPPVNQPAFDLEQFSLLPLLWPFAPQEGPFEITGTMDFVPMMREITTSYEAGSVNDLLMHDGSVIKLHKLAKDWDPFDRLSAANALQRAKQTGEILTGLLYIDRDSHELHDLLKTSDRPLNSLPKDALCPGSDALVKLNASLR
jgi:hypothetical protein